MNFDNQSAFTVEDYTDGIKDRKKTTSTSPSGRHLENKAALHDEDLSQIHVDMLILLILYGFAPERRLLSVTTLVEEEDGKLYLSKLRVIHFVEADYNLFLKLLYTYCMVCTAEKG